MALTPPSRILGDEQQSMNLSPTTSLEFIRRLIADIRTSIAQLRPDIEEVENPGAPSSGNTQSESVDHENGNGAHQEEDEPQQDENGDEIPEGLEQSAQHARGKAMRALRARQSRPRDLDRGVGTVTHSVHSAQGDVHQYAACRQSSRSS
ncbi:unnamed protein product [Parnassius apollo]|uniref:(apollo) hypothetical protein n=1 Tax=Parnassius apollo TaxID=110799 RepID=A0A8S3X2T7_PARAO|nr:unnamed protein product [Parnassius apollo]